MKNDKYNMAGTRRCPGCHRPFHKKGYATHIRFCPKALQVRQQREQRLMNFTNAGLASAFKHELQAQAVTPQFQEPITDIDQHRQVLHVPGRVIGFGTSGTQRVGVVSVENDLIWVQSMGAGTHHIIRASDVVVVELSSQITFRVQVEVEDEDNGDSV